MIKLVDGAKYQGEPGVAFWCEAQQTFVDCEGKPVPDFQPHQLDEEVPMAKYFVHRYDVVRVKVAVEARSQQEAMVKADQFLAQRHPLADCYHSVGDEERIAQHYGFPTWIHYEKAEDVTGYLVDEFGDEDHERSFAYDAEHNRVLPSWAEHPDYPVDDWQYAVTNGDTRLGYDAWVGAQMQEAA